MLFRNGAGEAPDPRLTPELLARRERMERIGAKTTEEVTARKARSIAILTAEKIPFIDHLPVIQDEAESAHRTKEEVAARAIALFVAALKGEGLEQEDVEAIAEKYEIADALSPHERWFLHPLKRARQEYVQFCWRYECFWVMLWALGFIESLGHPKDVCDCAVAGRYLLDKSRDEFVAKAKLRPLAEILDMAHLYYRYDWAAVNSGKDDNAAGVDSGVVHERHYALNWLIGYMDAEWDDVTTDT